MDSNSINWASLEHAYGSAENIPELLEKIKSNKANAVSELSNLIAHQGWMTPETAIEVVPFLCEMLPSISGKTRALVIMLLTDLMCCGSHEHFLSGERTDILFESEVVEIRKQVLTYSSSVLSYIDDKSHLVRKAVAVFAAISEVDIAVIENRLVKEKQETTKADLLISLGWRCADLNNEIPSILFHSLSDKSPVVESAAAFALSYLLPIKKIGSEHFINAFESVKSNGCMWNWGDFQNMAIELVLENCRKHKDSEPLYDLLDNVPQNPQSSIIGAILESSFRDIVKNKQVGLKAKDLNGSQIQALELALKYGKGTPYEFRKLELPVSPPAIRLFLGIECSKDLLDRTVIFNNKKETVRSFVETICVENNFDEIIEFSKAIAPIYSNEECPSVALLIYQTNKLTTENKYLVDFSSKDKNVLLMHFIMNKVESAFKNLKDDLFAYMVDEPKWWGMDNLYVGHHFITMVWSVLLKLDAEIEIPRAMQRGSSSINRIKIDEPIAKQCLNDASKRLVELGHWFTITSN